MGVVVVVVASHVKGVVVLLQLAPKQHGISEPQTASVFAQVVVVVVVVVVVASHVEGVVPLLQLAPQQHGTAALQGALAFAQVVVVVVAVVVFGGVLVARILVYAALVVIVVADPVESRKNKKPPKMASRVLNMALFIV